VEIRVAEVAGRLRLRVTDDGQLDPARSTSHGFGLLRMAERVSSCSAARCAPARRQRGGRRRAADGGTQMTVRVLVADDQELVRTGSVHDP
jgi:hypothetical protein